MKITKQKIRREFKKLRKNIKYAKNQKALNYLENQTEKTRRKLINVYTDNYSSSYQKTLEKESKMTKERIENKRKRVE